MSVVSTLGDTLEAFHNSLRQGKSGISRWQNPPWPGSYSKIGGDLSQYPMDRKMSSLSECIPPDVFRRMAKLVSNSPRATGISICLAVEAFADSGLLGENASPERIAGIFAGHYLHDVYKWSNWKAFEVDPDEAEVSLALKEMETDALGCTMEVLGIHGSGFSTGGSCAAGNIALRSAIDEIRYHASDAALVVAPFHELTPASLHSLARLGTLSMETFDDEPQKASRPFDSRRNGFVPAMGGAALVIEELDHALRRGARIYAEIMGVGLNTNGFRNPAPQEDPIALVMELSLREAGVDRRDIDYISAHATSTQTGDLVEARAIRRVFGDHAGRLKVNALKSMLGHQLAASALVEMVACVLQMRAAVVYPTINVERIDPEIDLDVCANHGSQYRINCLMKNAFGFGGINSACILRRYE